ncbi:MAG: preprotein translocase subunit SecE [Candidatus Paceibacterota bacterium]|jgi:preprotein translocase SecE subunit
MSKAGDYLKDTAAEMKHVSWPTQSQSINYTLLVIGISVFVALFLYAFDEVFVVLLQKFILKI